MQETQYMMLHHHSNYLKLELGRFPKHETILLTLNYNRGGGGGAYSIQWDP